MTLYQFLWEIGWRSGIILCVVLIGEVLVEMQAPGWVGVPLGMVCAGIESWWYLQVNDRRARNR